MQNNNKSKGFRSFVKEKGYYIVLLLCAAAVGVSGYFLLSDRNEASPEETPVVATVSPTVSPSEKPSTAVSEGTTPPTRSEGFGKTTKPVAGEELTAFAADHLAYNETTRDWRTHEGVDLSAAQGEIVTAAANGTVHTIYEDNSLGMTVVLTHSDGYTTHYSNLAEDIPVSVGDTVAAGSTLGTVGQTANSETAIASHLHFAVYKDNAPGDPAEYFAKAE